MLNKNEQQNISQTGVPSNVQFGGHELFDIDEALGGVVGCIEHCSIFEQYIQDEQLLLIIQRQKAFLSELYNTILDTLKSGKDPAVKTSQYMMQEDNATIYGLKPSTPKVPINSISEIKDDCISSAHLGHLKGIASHFTVAAIETTNPVMRRILADSVPNVIEMAYELFLYENKMGYYQVAQLQPNDMNTIINSYAPVSMNQTH